MEREEAIDIIKNYDVNDCGYCHQGGDEVEAAFNIAIKALEQEPCDDCISRQAAIKIIKNYCENGCDIAEDNWCPSCQREQFIKLLEALSSAQPEWNNHTVACLLAELFDDTCACNYNGIDEWLPEKCEVIDACPNPVGVACWEQFLKHKAKRRSDE